MANVPQPEGWMTKPVGLDFGAVMMVGAGAGVDLAMLAEILPRIEQAIVFPADMEMEGGDDDGDS